MNPLYRHSETLSKASKDMGEKEQLLGGLENLGLMSTIYEQNHHLFQLLETDAVITNLYTKGFSGGEAKAFIDGVKSILTAMQECYLEVQAKNLATQIKDNV